MEFFDTTVFVGVIASIATVLSASIPYYLGKRSERKERIREKKISTYDELSLKLTEYFYSINSDVDSTDDIEKTKGFTLAYHRAIAYANPNVIKGCDEFLLAVSAETLGQRQKYQQLLKISTAMNEILENIRQDLNPNLQPLPDTWTKTIAQFKERWKD